MGEYKLKKNVVVCMLLIVCCACTQLPKPEQEMESNYRLLQEQLPAKKSLLYSRALSDKADTQDWIMEGPGKIDFKDGWMQMHSPNEEMHHVFWCPVEFPSSFIAQWQVQNLKTEAGLVIVFFSATGTQGENIFAPHLAPRDGTFDQYTLGDINSYHISYYANAAHNPNRGHANLRKNNTFSLLQTGDLGIPTNSTDVHLITLVKEDNKISLFVDNRKVIDYVDDSPQLDGVDIGPPLSTGLIGFRQMKWTQFQYKNFKVWSIE